MQRFGEKVRWLRQQRNMTLAELATRLSYHTHSYLSEIESGRKTPTVPFVLNVAEIFGVTTDELLKDELEIGVLGDTTAPLKEKNEMPIIFAERNPTQDEFERFRLILSTFQDGSGMLTVKNQRDWIERNRATSLPGWRDFERSVAIAFEGVAIESKFIYDVLLPRQHEPGTYFGLSCKMRGELRKADREGRASIELSNAAGEFWDAIKTQTGLSEENYHSAPEAVGHVLIQQVISWHVAEDMSHSGKIETSKSAFLNLLWDERSGEYQLFQFPISLPDATAVNWRVDGRRLVGSDESGAVIIEWYGFSGGQLKYYPPVELARWRSEKFILAPLPENNRNVMLEKAAAYYPNAWNSHAES